MSGNTNGLITGAEMHSMSVMRGDGGGDIISVVYSSGLGSSDPAYVERYNEFGQPIDFTGFIFETISSSGEPGLLRLDSSLPASKVPIMKYDNFTLKDLVYPPGSGTKATFNSPTIGSFVGHATTVTGMENLVMGRNSRLGNNVTLFCQGAEAGMSAYVNINNTSFFSPQANPRGQIEATASLDFGFNTIWVESNRGGVTNELLKRHVLVIDTPLLVTGRSND